MVIVIAENRLTVISMLDDVMRLMRNNKTRQSGHDYRRKENK
jgi:hypothetical protein